MNVAEFVALQKHFLESKALPGGLVSKYEILPRPVLLSARCDVPLRIRAFRWLRDLLVGLKMIKPGQFGTAWSPKLKHVPAAQDAKVVLFWAVAAYDRQVAKQIGVDLMLRVALASTRLRGQCPDAHLGHESAPPACLST